MFCFSWEDTGSHKQREHTESRDQKSKQYKKKHQIVEEIPLSICIPQAFYISTVNHVLCLEI